MGVLRVDLDRSLWHDITHADFNHFVKDLEFFLTGRLTDYNRPIDATKVPTKAPLIAVSNVPDGNGLPSVLVGYSLPWLDDNCTIV